MVGLYSSYTSLVGTKSLLLAVETFHKGGNLTRLVGQGVLKGPDVGFGCIHVE